MTRIPKKHLMSLLLFATCGQQFLWAQGLPVKDHKVAQTPSAVTAGIGRVDLHDVGAGETLHITVGHSVVLHGTAKMRRIYVSTPTILQSFNSGPDEVVLTAKAPGISSLVIWDTTGHMSLYMVSADVDPDALQQALNEAYPASHIGVSGREGRIYLSGSVPSQEVADGSAKIAALYAKDVVSSVQLVPVHGKQVQLKLRIVEVDRTRMEQYGLNIFAGGKVPLGITTSQYPSSVSTTSGSSSSATVSDPLNIFLYSQALNLGVTVKDLEQKQILQVLAEPTLTAMSGQSAKFLSGGEFPYPVVQGSSTPGASAAITIMFRPYGVKVEFTPTVNLDGSIRLKVAPEVSTLDFANAVTISGFTIPALSTRRAETEVEIQSGQSFAVSGLLDHRTTESLSRLPGIASIPILGKIFVSKSYTHSVVELVVLVTATVVDPLTDSMTPVEPHFPVPNLDDETFDRQLSKEQNLQPQKR
jgi:pilus assembly protein CpaC